MYCEYFLEFSANETFFRISSISILSLKINCIQTMPIWLWIGRISMMFESSWLIFIQDPSSSSSLVEALVQEATFCFKCTGSLHALNNKHGFLNKLDAYKMHREIQSPVPRRSIFAVKNGNVHSAFFALQSKPSTIKALTINFTEQDNRGAPV